ncbi:hypothetical protein [Streptomyces omiyaensis]|uniref:DNA primase/polymerase bifunctional N-terminal domain-containing protein n=1 Tax=Streptomyces omiyaensis TaxID=68247 RepID=A0ABW7BL91_9ACTN|nr:hypothetical protein [Streptomyces omiyaensis]GGY25035.1 hypothetical protein GCM10010363_01480 [Streptomyces omiyaensis]
MNLRKSLDSKPSWVPGTGHALRLAGVHFDAVRIGGYLGEEVAYRLMEFTDFRAGPIVREATRGRNLYFLLAPGTASGGAWPAPVRALCGNGGGESYVGIPALDGTTWPLGWRSLPTLEDPFVEGELLRRTVERALR